MLYYTMLSVLALMAGITGTALLCRQTPETFFRLSLLLLLTVLAILGILATKGLWL